jgi:putative ABC transport system permease protein
VPLLDRVVGDVRPTLLVLFGGVAFVLLVACTNVANLVLTRGSARTREFAVRSMLGAGRARLAGQALMESLVLGLAGGAVGLALAAVGTGALRRFAAADFPRVQGAAIDQHVLAFTLLASLGASVLFGLAPMLRFSKPDLRAAAGDGSRGSSGSRSRTRDGLVVVQIAVSLVLVIGSGLMIKSFARLLAVDPGFDTEHVLAMQVWLPRPNVPESGRFFTQDQRLQMFDYALGEMEAIPGVERAGIVSILPLRGTGSTTVELEGAASGELDDPPVAEIRTVSSGYFEVMGIRVGRGRSIRVDDDARAAPVVVVNEAFVDAHSAGVDPVGRRVRIGSGPFSEIVGVVSNVRHQALDVEPRPTVYRPYRQGVGRSMTFVLRTAGAPAAMARPATEALQRVDADLPVYAVASMDTVLAGTLAQRRTLMVLLSLFAVQAVVLAVIGVYGVIAYATRQRRREIGIRMALGAKRGTVIAMILRQGTVLGLLGVGGGLVCAAGLTRLLRSFLFDVEHLDPAVFAGVALFWLALAGLAALVPARGGTRVHPAEVVRTE